MRIIDIIISYYAYMKASKSNIWKKKGGERGGRKRKEGQGERRKEDRKERISSNKYFFDLSPDRIKSQKSMNYIYLDLFISSRSEKKSSYKETKDFSSIRSYDEIFAINIEYISSLII